MLEVLSGALALLAAQAVDAQSVSQPAVAAVDPAVSPDPVVAVGAASVEPCACLIIPALTPVSLEIQADLGSKISTTGGHFPVSLLAPVIVDGREVIPAGTTGEGEIVHAKKAGGSGAGGELVLAARFLAIGDRRLKLRSMRLALAGRDASQTVNAINAASAAGPLPIGLIGFAITGRNVLVPKGTTANARTAEAFSIETGQPAALAREN